ISVESDISKVVGSGSILGIDAELLLEFRFRLIELIFKPKQKSQIEMEPGHVWCELDCLAKFRYGLIPALLQVIKFSHENMYKNRVWVSLLQFLECRPRFPLVLFSLIQFHQRKESLLVA